MTDVLRDSLVFSAFVGDKLVEVARPAAKDIVATLARPDVWHEASVHPQRGSDFPRLVLSFHAARGFVLVEHEQFDTGIGSRLPGLVFGNGGILEHAAIQPSAR